MTKWRVEIKDKEGVFDSIGDGIRRDILDLGINSVSKVEVSHVYTLEGSLSEGDVQNICQELLVNHVIQDSSYSNGRLKAAGDNIQAKVVEIAFNPGVMDPVEESTLKGIRDLDIDGIDSVRTSKKYAIYGNISSQQLDTIVTKILSNKLIQHVVDHQAVESLPEQRDQGGVEVTLVDLLSAKDKDLKRISEQGQLFLNLNEMKAIQKHFKKQKRNPTDCELETIAQTWSEHCYHKTFRGIIEYTEKEGGKTKTKTIRNLLKSTIAKTTFQLDKPWCVSVFHDNAGVIKFDKDHHVCFKVETHNHPSALEPFGGANTGIGGVIRDTLGTGLGAKPICNTDIFCFAPPDMKHEDLPAGTLHPKRVMKGVVSGVRDYGNKMGIPTVNGAIVFDEHFVGNPLVYCGNVGLIPKDKVKKRPRTGDCVVVLGGKTGRDGIHGATFSSGELTSESEVVSSGAVQIGDPIQEKKVLDALLQARDEGLYTAVTDCGAGGLSSAVGEMGEHLGARVDLEHVPLKYRGLKYMEIWISESQERMVISVPKKNVKRLKEICEKENVEASVIGEFTKTKRLELFFKGCQVCDLDMEFLHAGPPKIVRKAKWQPPKTKKFSDRCPTDLTQALKQVLSHYNVCSKEWVIRQYDHEVQAGSVVKPLVGINCDGPSDASVVLPKLNSKKGIAVSNGINIRFGMIDPYWMAASCIDEAIRQIVAVGGNPQRIALLDNFCWGNPEKPDRLGSLVRTAQGCYKTALDYGAPFISGKDSLYNEYTEGGKSIAIPGTILISAIGMVDDVYKCITMDLKAPGNLIYIVGQTFDELGGSIYLDTREELGANVPRVNTKKGNKIFQSMHEAINRKLITSAHDCSEGGLAVAIAEMAFSGGLGADINLADVPFKGDKKRDDTILFSETNSRFIVEVSPKKQKEFEKSMKGVVCQPIGAVTDSDKLLISGIKDSPCIKAELSELKESWQSTLRW